MIIRDFYEGGMILFDHALAYEYEEWLSGMLKRRLKAWWDKQWWLHSFMYDEFDRRHYNKNAFHVLPGDPLVLMPDMPKMLLLKGRFLHRLRQEAIKRARREYRCKGIPT